MDLNLALMFSAEVWKKNCAKCEIEMPYQDKYPKKKLRK